MVRKVRGTNDAKSPRKVRKVHGTNRPWYEKSGIRNIDADIFTHVRWLRLSLKKAPRSFNCKPGRIDHGEFKDRDFDDIRQSEIAIWPPKSEVL